MQNLITNNSTINLDEILTNNLTSNTEAKTAQKNEFEKVLNNITKDKRPSSDRHNLHNDLKNIKNDKKFTTKDTNSSQKTVSENNITKENVTPKDTKNTQESADKNVDSFESGNIKNEAKKIETGETQALSADELIQDVINRLNQSLENALDGQLNIDDINNIKGTLEQIQTQIDNNQIVVSEQTQKNLTAILDRLTSQDPKALEVKVLEQDLKQLQQDIRANTFKLESQVKLEQEQNNPKKAIEINTESSKNIQTDNSSVSQEKTLKTAKTSEALVGVSQNVKEASSKDTVQKVQNDPLEQNMLDEMEVKIEEVSNSDSSGTNSQNSSFSNAQDEVIKLNIENADTSETPVTFSFDNRTIKPVADIKTAPLDGVAKEINKTDILNQIGSKFEQLRDGSNTKITMTLRPNDLGRVTIEMSQSANGITTNIIAQNSQVKELLDKNIDVLKQQLAQQGVNVQNVQVKTVEQNAQTGLNNNFDSQKDSKGQEQNNNQSQNNRGSNNQERRFAFSQTNVIDGADFESTNSQTAQINTAGGKISYNI